MPPSDFLTAKEAAAALGVSLPTLYSYVSRGLIRSEALDAGRRTRRYRRADVDKLKQRKEQRRNPAKIVEDALHWGTPLLDSAISLIADHRLYYRGRNALALAEQATVEEVAALIWAADLQAEIPGLRVQEPWRPSPETLAVRAQVQGLPVMEQFQVLLPLAAAADWAAYNLQPPAVRQCGARILRLMVSVAADGRGAGDSVARILQAAWAPDTPPAARLLNAALILCADHELNVSSFTARCVASAGATPYQVVIAGLAALQGAKHGRVSERVEAFLRELDAFGDIRAVIAGRLKRGEDVPGFGHPLYPQGDPRGQKLLEMATALVPGAKAMGQARAVAAAVLEMLGQRPTVDFGLVMAAQALNLPPGSALALFALGRTIGWIGHAIEAYQADRIIRPRARYVGVRPEG